jgi:hypothetical protein
MQKESTRQYLHPPVRLPRVFYFLGVCATGDLGGVLGSEAGIALQHRFIGAADFGMRSGATKR